MATLRPFNLVDLELEGERIRNVAREKAKEILRGAILQGDRLREQSRQEGMTLGKTEGLRLGMEEGRRQGLKEERGRIDAEIQRLAAETAPVRATLESLAREITGQRRELVTQAERDLVGLALAIARRVVKVRAAQDPAVLLGNVREAILLTARKTEIDVVVHPTQKAVIETHLPEIRREILEIQGLNIVGDETIAPGGCIVRTRQGAVNAELDVQLQEIEQVLLGERREA